MYENANSKRFCSLFNADSANLHITDRLKKQILIRKNLAPHELHFGMNTLGAVHKRRRKSIKDVGIFLAPSPMSEF